MRLKEGRLAALDGSFRLAARPDSGQVLGGMLSSRLPTSFIGGSLSVSVPAGHRVEVRAEEGTARLSVELPASRPLYRSITRRGSGVAKVFIGVDPQELSATIEVIDDHLTKGRFSTDKVGYAAMRKDGVEVARAHVGGRG
jgi:hypothetical protein